jgi:hypothetical protein
MCFGRSKILKQNSHGGRDPEKGDSDFSDFSLVAISGNEVFKNLKEDGVKESSLFESKRHAAMRIMT